MTNNEFFAKSREIGRAVWLIMLYWALTDQGLPRRRWFVVMNGEPLEDADVAAFFDVSTVVAERWRKRLMKTGFVRARPFGRGYKLRVQRPDFAMAAIRTLQAHSEVRFATQASNVLVMPKRPPSDPVVKSEYQKVC